VRRKEVGEATGNQSMWSTDGDGSGVGLAVELNSGHNDRFSSDPGEATAMKDFGQDFGRCSSDKSCRPELYTGACGRREKTRGGGHMTWALGGDGVPTCGPRRGKKETDRWAPCIRNFQNKTKLKMLFSTGK
jgi:hypothetical protein